MSQVFFEPFFGRHREGKHRHRPGILERWGRYIQILGVGSILAALSITIWWVYLIWPRVLVPVSFPPLPACRIVGEQIVVTLPDAYLLAEIAQYDDEFLAFLMFDHLRGVFPLNQAEVLFGYRISTNRPKYLVLVHLENNLLTGLALLFRLQAERLISDFQWRFTDGETLKTRRQQSQIFETAYNLPIRRKL